MRNLYFIKAFADTFPKPLTILLFMLLSFSNIKATTSIAADHPSYGGTLTWGTINPPTIINPVLTSYSVSSSLLALIFDSLVRIDSKGQVTGDLAKSWEVSKDGLEYTFYLRHHVYFHDGIECTAEDIKFT